MKKKIQQDPELQEIVIGARWTDPSSFETILDLLSRIKKQLTGLIEFSSLNRKLKWELQQMVDEIEREVGFSTVFGFDMGVHLSMLRLAGIDTDKDHALEWLSPDEKRKLLSVYQKAAEEYVMNHRKGKK